MIPATRREVMLGAAAAPALAGLPRWEPAGARALVHDPSLAAGRRFAEAHALEALAIEGDRIRFARALFAREPLLVVGVSRSADALLIEDVGREAGYVPVGEGAEALRALIEASDPRERTLARGWVLARRR